jgi:hypothetical protein
MFNLQPNLLLEAQKRVSLKFLCSFFLTNNFSLILRKHRNLWKNKIYIIFIHDFLIQFCTIINEFRFCNHYEKIHCFGQKMFFFGKIWTLFNKNNSIGIHTKDFCGKKIARKSPNFKEFFLSKIILFRQ